MIWPIERTAMAAAYLLPGATVESVAAEFERGFNATRRQLHKAGVLRERGRQTGSFRGDLNGVLTTLKPDEPRRRFARHGKIGKPMRLDADNPAVVEARTLFPNRRTDPADVDTLLKSGEHQRKLGSHVTKGAWRGMPIFTLTLEERATCSRTCHHWRSCMGNRMSWSTRLQHGPALEARLEVELAALARKHRTGFVVRLHILGDFYSAAYVRKWLGWLDRFPGLRVFGYTAWPATSEIGTEIAAATATRWDRFAVRFSTDANTAAPGPRAVTVVTTEKRPRTIGSAFVCPVQTDRATCCGSCSACWASRRDVAFILH